MLTSIVKLLFILAIVVVAIAFSLTYQSKKKTT